MLDCFGVLVDADHPGPGVEERFGVATSTEGAIQNVPAAMQRGGHLGNKDRAVEW
jgi:hypothetical protein